MMPVTRQCCGVSAVAATTRDWIEVMPSPLNADSDSQFFDGGQAFHSVGVSMWNPPGSHGCVNMRKADAKKYWSLLKKNDDVYVYGRKPGT